MGTVTILDQTDSPVWGSPESIKELDWTEPYHPYLELKWHGGHVQI